MCSSEREFTAVLNLLFFFFLFESQIIATKCRAKRGEEGWRRRMALRGEGVRGGSGEGKKRMGGG